MSASSSGGGSDRLKAATKTIIAANTISTALGQTSKLKNLTATILHNKIYEGTNVCLSIGSNLIRCNDTYFAIPWTRSRGALTGYLGVFPLSETGKANPNPFLINASNQLVDFEFYPFEKNIIATTGREQVIKVWKYPSEPLEEDIMVADYYLAGHEKKVDILKFHPTAAGVLLSCSSDMTCRVWDFLEMREIACLEGMAEAPISASWNFTGKNFVAALKDATICHFDPRAGNTPTFSVASELSPAKGLSVVYLGEQDFLSTGFSRSGEREIMVWDSRNYSKPVSSNKLGMMPGALTPFYDHTTGTLYVSAKGEGINVYEYRSDTKQMTFVNECKTERPQTSVALMPKYLNDTSVCEIARFLKLSNENFIQTISIRVPRKTKTSLFQEDLYPPMPSNQAAISSTEWEKGKNVLPKMIDLKPKDAKSVFDVSPEEGGIARIKPADNPLERRIPEVEGDIEIYRKGLFWSSWERRYGNLIGCRLHLLERKDATSTNLSVLLNKNSTIEELTSFPNQFVFMLESKTQSLILRVPTKELLEKWITVLRQVASMQKAGESSSEITIKAIEAPKTLDSEVSTSNQEESKPEKTIMLQYIHQGNLFSYEEGFWGRGRFVEKYFVLEEGSLNFYTDERAFLSEKAPVESLRVQHILSVRFTDVNASFEQVSAELDETMTTFQINTFSKVYFFQAKEPQTALMWVLMTQETAAKALKKYTPQYSALDLAEIREIVFFSVEGYILKKGVIQYEKKYLTIVGGDFYYFNHHMSPNFSEKMAGSDVDSVEYFDENGQFGFKLLTKLGVIYHLAVDKRMRNWWIKKIQKFLDSRFNLYEKMEIAQILENKSTLDKMDRYAETKTLDPSKVKSGETPILFHIKGKRITYSEIVPANASSLNGDSVYVLDCGSIIYTWSGSRTTLIDSAKGADLANRIRKEERGGNATVVKIEENSGRVPSPFFKCLGLKSVDDLIECDKKKGEAYEGKGSKSSVIILKISDSEDTRKRIQMTFNDDEKLPSKSLLSSDYCYVIDAEKEIYLWVGTNSSPQMRKLGNVVMKRMLCEENRSPFTVIARINENTETIPFKEKFSDYPSTLPVNVQPVEILPTNIAPKLEQPPIDVEKMHSEAPQVEDYIDNGSGEVESWLVVQRTKTKSKEWDREKIEDNLFGHLYSGESFLFIYKYIYKNTPRYIVYFWQGRDSSISEKGASALETINIADELGDARQIRIVQGKETKHFCSIFGEAGLVVHLGKFKEPRKKTEYYQVRERYGFQVAMEVDTPDNCLNSNHMSFIMSERKIYFWYGKNCSKVEREYEGLSMFTESQMKDVERIEEEKEPSEFMRSCYGEYAYNPSFPPRQSHYKPSHCKLFLCSGASGIITFELVNMFTQDDLENDHVMILDCFDEVFVWIGENATSAEKELALNTTVEYVKKSTKGHKQSTKLRVTHPFQEPIEFTRHFHGWTRTKFPQPLKKPRVLPLQAVLETFQNKSYPIEVLTGQNIPEHLERSKLESYLSDEDFQKVFGVSKERFYKLSEWKRVDL